jgi:hypothetical protein
MSTESRLDQVVKGAPPSTVHMPPPAPLTTSPTPTIALANDPTLATLPSSPPQIYLNLLILESSLRSQYLHLTSRRRLNTFFLLLLACWNGLFFYLLFLRPREDGSGLGGSVYWFFETCEKLALLGGMFTAWLIYITGQWERGVRWPRKWVGTTNRGLRTFNLRVVVNKRPIWSHLSFLVPMGLFAERHADWHVVEEPTGRIVEEDLAPGGGDVQLLLLPKSFSPEFREEWDNYRSEYWERENARRLSLKVKMLAQKRTKAKEMGGWKWWTGMWRMSPAHAPRRHHDLEKHPQHGSQRHKLLPDQARRRSILRSDSTNHSRQSSRSSRASTPTPFDGPMDTVPLGERVRRGSSSASTRKKRDSIAKSGGGSARNSMVMSPLTNFETPGTPEEGNSPEKKKHHHRKRTGESNRHGTPESDSGEKMAGRVMG